MRRGELWRYDPVVSRAGQSITRLVISSDALNRNDALPIVYVMQVVDTDPGSLLAVRVGNHGWALATGIDRRCANASPNDSVRPPRRRWNRSTTPSGRPSTYSSCPEARPRVPLGPLRQQPPRRRRTCQVELPRRLVHAGTAVGNPNQVTAHPGRRSRLAQRVQQRVVYLSGAPSGVAARRLRARA